MMPLRPSMRKPSHGGRNVCPVPSQWDCCTRSCLDSCVWGPVLVYFINHCRYRKHQLTYVPGSPSLLCNYCCRPPITPERVLTLLESLGTAGNLVTDAQIAAAALENEATVHTSDADFIRFPNLKWFNPISGLGAPSVRRARPKKKD